MQKVIRTYPHGFTNETTRLSDALSEGYKVVFINNIKTTRGYDCLEYIVEKEVE